MVALRGYHEFSPSRVFVGSRPVSDWEWIESSPIASRPRLKRQDRLCRSEANDDVAVDLDTSPMTKWSGNSCRQLDYEKLERSSRYWVGVRQFVVVTLPSCDTIPSRENQL